ncbi:MAG: MOSC domain-containing protein [Clostridia bacterium]|jgi:MOSC domain-containing protein YiiM|nr:MOSC domain-containing protein [Clostridia bacterium]MDH7572084.1 MOSC domain-containing protein [Clostridia bacterium]
MAVRGKVVAVCTSRETGVPKQDVGRAYLVREHGLEGDAHAGDWHRQVSLLGVESIAKMRALGLEVGPGDFAENITTEGLDLWALPIGTRLRLGPEVLVEVTQIGKTCHTGCAIFQKTGKCIMPKEGIFARVLKGGWVQAGDDIVEEET